MKNTSELSNSQRKILDMMAHFYKLRDIKEDGVPVYTYALCVKRTAKKFYLAEQTVSNYLTTYDELYQQYKKV